MGPAITDDEEKQALIDGNWHPATLDFLAVMGSNVIQGMGRFASILVQIVKFPAGTVKRVNFMTHSNSTTLGIKGHNILGNVVFKVEVTDKDINQGRRSPPTAAGRPSQSRTSATASPQARSS